jgi:hypothetical protein
VPAQPASTKKGRASREIDWVPSMISCEKVDSGTSCRLSRKNPRAGMAIAQVMGVRNTNNTNIRMKGPQV